jgi:hypothetical protein
MLLANFTDSKGVLQVYEKNKPVRGSIPENECRERDFYEYELDGRKTNNKFENWLEGVETEAGKILPSVANRQVLIGQDCVNWATFIASLFYRTRKVRKQISDAMILRFKEQVRDPDFIRNMQCELLKQGELRYFDDLRKEANELLTQMEKSPSFYHVSAMPRQTAWIAQILLRRRWDTVDAPPEKQFLLSDCPVMPVELTGHQGLPGAGFGGENTAVLVPITRQKLFVASPHGCIWQTEAEPRAIDMVNLLVVQFGHRNVYASNASKDIQVLVDREINRVEFGKTAFVPKAKS